MSIKHRQVQFSAFGTATMKFLFDLSVGIRHIQFQLQYFVSVAEHITEIIDFRLDHFVVPSQGPIRGYDT